MRRSLPPTGEAGRGRPVKIGRIFADLLSPLSADIPFAEGLSRTLHSLVQATGASAGLLTFEPPRGQPLAVTVAARGVSPAVEAAMRSRPHEAPRTTRR